MDWGYTEKGTLVPGNHQATWQEVQDEFGFTERRRNLLSGMLEAFYDLQDAGCQQVFLDGSFVTRKPEPDDFDAAWNRDGVDLRQLLHTAPQLLDFSNGRAAMKAKYKGELFIADLLADSSGTVFLDFFQRDRDDDPKGIVSIELSTLP